MVTIPRLVCQTNNWPSKTWWCDIKGRFEIYSIHSKMNVNWAEIFKNIWSKVHWITFVVNRNDSFIVTEFNASKSINDGFRNSEKCVSDS